MPSGADELAWPRVHVEHAAGERRAHVGALDLGLVPRDARFRATRCASRRRGPPPAAPRRRPRPPRRHPWPARRPRRTASPRPAAPSCAGTGAPQRRPARRPRPRDSPRRARRASRSRGPARASARRAFSDGAVSDLREQLAGRHVIAVVHVQLARITPPDTASGVDGARDLRTMPPTGSSLPSAATPRGALPGLPPGVGCAPAGGLWHEQHVAVATTAATSAGPRVRHVPSIENRRCTMCSIPLGAWSVVLPGRHGLAPYSLARGDDLVEGLHVRQAEAGDGGPDQQVGASSGLARTSVIVPISVAFSRTDMNPGTR